MAFTIHFSSKFASFLVDVKQPALIISMVIFYRSRSFFSPTSFFFIVVTARRLEKEVKQVLEEISHDQVAKERLIRGRQVDLAEELSK